MSQSWRSIEIFLPAGLSMDDVKKRVRGDILCTANECGEFVRRIRLGTSTEHADGWRKWSASYLPGPPGLFRG